MNSPGGVMPGGSPANAPPGYDPNDPMVKRMSSLMESCYAKTVLSGGAGFGLGALFGMFMASMSYDTPFHTPGAAPPTVSTPTAATAATAGKPTSGATAPTATSTTTTTPTSSATSTAPKIQASTALPRPSPLVHATSTGALAASHMHQTPITSLPLRQQLVHGFRDMGSRSYSTAKNFAMVGALFSGIECGIEGYRAKNDLANPVAAGCLTGAVLARNGGPQAVALGCAGFAAFSLAIDSYLRMPSDE